MCIFLKYIITYSRNLFHFTNAIWTRFQSLHSFMTVGKKSVEMEQKVIEKREIQIFKFKYLFQKYLKNGTKSPRKARNGTKSHQKA